MSDEAPRAENGVLVVGPWNEALEAQVLARWPQARFVPLDEALTRVDLSATPRGSCPGFNDTELLQALSGHVAGMAACGFFCDGIRGAEGVRLFESGQQRDRRRVDWAGAQPPDPMAWPIATLALSLRLPVEAITRVERPPRPPQVRAVEALFRGEEAETPELTHQALQLLGHLPIPEASDVIVRFLQSEDWVARYHAARAYTRVDRGPGREGRPRLEALLDDADESVREAALTGLGELLPGVEFSNDELQTQIDAAIARGLADEDEDVRAVAEELRAQREALLG